MTKKRYIYNQILFSPLGNRFYFAPKVEVLSDDGRRAQLLVRGKKYDVTESMQDFVTRRYRYEVKEKSWPTMK